GVLEALGAGAGVGAAGVEDDGGQLPALEDLLGPQDGRRLDAVGGEDAGGGAAGTVVDHEGQVRVPALLDPGGDARRRESLGCRDTHCVSSFTSPPARCGGAVVVCGPAAAVATVTGRPRWPSARWSRRGRGRCSCSARHLPRCPWSGCRWR